MGNLPTVTVGTSVLTDRSQNPASPPSGDSPGLRLARMPVSSGIQLFNIVLEAQLDFHTRETLADEGTQDPALPAGAAHTPCSVS